MSLAYLVTAFAAFAVPPAAGAEPPSLLGAQLQPAAPARPVKFDPRAVVAQIRKIVSDTYVLPERRPALDAVLAEGLSSGRYDVRDPALLAERIDADLRRVGRDHHLNFRYDPIRFERMTARTGDDRPDMSALEAQVRAGNHGVRELKVLPGNIRYLDLAQFDWIGEESEAALDTALQFLSGGSAVIIDLRNNGGGHPQAVHHLISHFMEPDRPLVTFHMAGRPSETMSTFTTLKVPRMIGKPLYVLISGVTGSAAEEFVGHVAGYRLGELVGANTSGGAFMNQLIPIPGGFVLSVSTGRSVLAATGKDWEGVGFAPTVAAPADKAMEAAQVHALRRIAAGAEGSRRATLEGLAEGIEAIGRPGTPAAPLSAYAGTYGDREIVLEGGALWLRRKDQPTRRLVSLGGHRFTLADDPLLRMVFQAEGGRAKTFEVGPAPGPATGRYERTR